MDGSSAVRVLGEYERFNLRVCFANLLDSPYIAWGVARVVALGNISGRRAQLD